MRAALTTFGTRRQYALALVITLIVTALVAIALVAWAGKPVASTIVQLVLGGFGSRFALSETLTRAIPLTMVGLAISIAFKAKLFNIGAEGQFYVGALAAVAVGGAYDGTGLQWPTWLLFPLMMLASAAAGAVLLMGPAWLKLRLGVDEVVTTLLLNFIVLLAVSALLDGVMKDPMGAGWPQSIPIQSELELSRLLTGTRLHSGLVWAVVLTGVSWLLLERSVFGFDVRATGMNAIAARFAGIDTMATTLWAAAASGAMAGLTGALEVAGRTGYVTTDLSPGYGYSGIVIAVLANLRPPLVLLFAVVVAGLQVGADSMSRAVGVPSYLADVLVAAALLASLASNIGAQYLRRRAGRAA